MVLFTDAQLIRLLLVFWGPATLGHFIGYFFANRDDILLTKYMPFGHIIAWGIIALMTYLIVVIYQIAVGWLWLYFIIHIFIVSTLLSDLFSMQDSFNSKNIKLYLMENLKESILIPWAAGFAVGIPCAILLGV